MKVLIAPDKFKDALGAAAVAAAIAEGVREAIPNVEIEVCPLADGGEGSGELLGGAVGAEERTADVLDPLGSPRRARWWTAADSRQAIVELAEASGLHLVPPALRNPRRTSSYGAGQLLRAAIDSGATRITLCAGGSATVDAGAGCLQALGFEFFGADERPLATPVCPETLAALQRIRPGPLPACELVILTDVDNPLLGDNGAARVFGPQKGARQQDIGHLEETLARVVRCLAGDEAAAVGAIAGGGAAGGLPAGLIAAGWGRIESGFEAVAREVRLEPRLKTATICVTGEGRLDSQTGRGKVVSGVAQLGRKLGIPVVALVGQIQLAGEETLAECLAQLGLTDAVPVTPIGTPREEALMRTRENLRRAAAGYFGVAGGYRRIYLS